MTHAVISALAVLGVVGEVLVAIMIVIGLAAAFGARGGLTWLRRLVWGNELWISFGIAAIATGGSLFLSEVAGFVPCELCWYQRICMYPLSILTLFAAYNADYRLARYLLPFPVVGAGVAVFHLLVENHWVATPAGCQIGAGCTVKWINYFGYMTIPTLALTAFLLLIGFLLLAAAGEEHETAILRADA